MAAKGTPGPWWADAAVGAAALGAWTLGAAQLLMAPTPEAATAGVLRGLVAGGALAAAGGVAARLLAREPQRTAHDWACGTYITGLPGSGKTALALLLLREWSRRRWGWSWLSIKGGKRALAYIPRDQVDRVVLLQPAGPYPKGLNLMKLYTGDALEREMVADQTAELFTREHRSMGPVMRDLLRFGCLALLEWGQEVGEEVTPLELYRFFFDAAYRRTVLARVGNPVVRDAFEADDGEDEALDRVRRQVRRVVATESLLASLGQRGGIDLWQVLQGERWLVVDAPEADLGPEGAAFFARLVVSRLQLLTSRRKPLDQGGRPYMAVCDEVQAYITPSFTKGLETGREYGMCWVLLHQSRSGQLADTPLGAAVQLCGTRFVFRQAVSDSLEASKALGGKWEPPELVGLPQRHYRAVVLTHGFPRYVEGRTPDLPPPDPLAASEVWERNATGPSRAEVLAELHRRMRQQGVSGW